MAEYKTITLQELVDLVNNNPKVFKNGMETKIVSGDFEGNYRHIKHEIMRDKWKRETVIFLGYEMHENDGE